MSSCINTGHPDFIKLQEQSGINQMILSAKIKTWQNDNGMDRFPTLGELRSNDMRTQLESLPSNTITKSQIEDILNYAKANFEVPVLVFKGIDGKKDIDGNPLSVHNVPGYLWGSSSYKDALTYARTTGGVEMHIVEGKDLDSVKAPGSTKMSERKNVEEDLIKKSGKSVI